MRKVEKKRPNITLIIGKKPTRGDDKRQEQEAGEEEEEAPVRCASAPPNAASPAVCARQSA